MSADAPARYVISGFLTSCPLLQMKARDALGRKTRNPCPARFERGTFGRWCRSTVDRRARVELQQRADLEFCRARIVEELCFPTSSPASRRKGPVLINTQPAPNPDGTRSARMPRMNTNRTGARADDCARG